MNKKCNKTWFVSPRSSAGAFTVLELLMVVVGISLLAVITLSAIKGVRNKAKNSQDQALVASLSQGCQAYAQDHNGLYPGQSVVYIKRMAKNPSGTTRMTGTQVMVAELMGLTVADDGVWSKDTSKPEYVSIKSKHIDLPTSENGIDESLDVDDDIDEGYTLTGVRHSVIDSHDLSPLPILYYVSRPGLSGSGDYGVFRYDDNVRVGDTVYPQDSKSTNKAFYEFITRDDKGDNDKVNDVMYNSDSFVIIAAGLDRSFFLPDNNGDGSNADENADNITNYNRAK